MSVRLVAWSRCSWFDVSGMCLICAAACACQQACLRGQCSAMLLGKCVLFWSVLSVQVLCILSGRRHRVARMGFCFIWQQNELRGCGPGLHVMYHVHCLMLLWQNYSWCLMHAFVCMLRNAVCHMIQLCSRHGTAASLGMLACLAHWKDVFLGCIIV